MKTYFSSVFFLVPWFALLLSRKCIYNIHNVAGRCCAMNIVCVFSKIQNSCIFTQISIFANKSQMDGNFDVQLFENVGMNNTKIDIEILKISNTNFQSTQIHLSCKFLTPFRFRNSKTLISGTYGILHTELGNLYYSGGKRHCPKSIYCS